MKILYLCTFYHRALLFRQQMDALIARGHDVRAFSSAEYGEGIAEKFKPIMDDRVKHFECWNRLDRIFFFPRQWKIEARLQKAYDLKEFDLLHAHLMLSSGYSALRMKKKYGLKYIVSVRDTDLMGFIKLPIFRRLARKIMEEAEGIIFLSYTHEKELLDMFQPEKTKRMIQEKSSVIGNCVEPFWEEHTVPEGRKAPDGNEIKVLTVAKIRPVKNIPAAAEAVNILNQRGVKASLTVVGENQDNAEYEKIKAYDHVTVLPFMSQEELIDIYRTHDVFLLPSIGETFGRVYVEAMTQGLPVLYTKGQGFDGYYEERTVGYAVTSGDYQMIADRIEKTMENYRGLSGNCVEKCKDFYEKKIIDKLESFYKECLSR